MDTLGFDEQFVGEIRTGIKQSTIRYPSGRQPEPNTTVAAVVSHSRGPFAKLRIQSVEWITVDEILRSNFDHHRNYSSLDEFNNHLSQYYNHDFSRDDEFILIEFECIEVLD